MSTGPGRPVGGDVKGLLDDPGDLVGVLHQVAVLGEGGHGAGDVHLLEDVPAQQVAWAPGPVMATRGMESM